MNYVKHILSLFLFLFFMSGSLANSSTNCDPELSSREKKDKLYNVNMTGVGIVTAWGVVHWDYFSQSPHANPEGWFGNNTDHGGADKLGHLYSTYVMSHGLSHLYEGWCFNKHDAALYGALSSFAIMGYMELGDSFSDFGFSYEDFVMNALGSVAGYYLYENPDLARKIDIRWEYGFQPNDADFTTDYENSKYLLAIKLNGFDSMRQGFLKYIELHLGYYTRGFDDLSTPKERNAYLGIGINLTDLFRRRGHTKTSTFLNYMQLPGTYLAIEKDRNK